VAFDEYFDSKGFHITEYESSRDAGSEGGSAGTLRRIKKKGRFLMHFCPWEKEGGRRKVSEHKSTFGGGAPLLTDPTAKLDSNFTHSLQAKRGELPPGPGTGKGRGSSLAGRGQECCWSRKYSDHTESGGGKM